MTAAGADASPVAPDRVHLPAVYVVVLSVTAGACLALAAIAIPADVAVPEVPIVGAFIAGVLAIAALRSVPVRATAQLTVLVSALLLMREGRMPTGQLGLSPFLVSWVAAATVTLVLASAADRFRGGPGATRRLTRLVAVAVCGVLAVVIVAVGPVTGLVSSGAQRGEEAEFDASVSGSALAATDELTMTDNPQLTDAVVMTVDAPVASFWRTQVFDQWTGTGWIRSDGLLRPLAGGRRVQPEPGDIAATEGRAMRSEFRIEASFASALPLTPSAESVDAPVTVRQTFDGSLVTDQPLGRGASFSIVSRQMDLSRALLRDAGDDRVPRSILDRYAVRPRTTDRVLRLADRLGAANPNAYDLVRAVETYLGDRTRYSIEAPPTPEGVDAVDHFLFSSRVGWCEQIATSLTVLLRANGVPARLAVGFAPSEYDPVTERFVVRERDAHAWTEVWFPRVGWVPFDPTASVPLAGLTAGGTGTSSAVPAGVATIAAVLIGVALVLALGPAAISFVLARLRRRGPVGGTVGVATPSSDWVQSVEARLERLGGRWQRPRGPTETTAVYAAHLGERSGFSDLAADLAAVGVVVDRERYSPAPATPDEQSAVVAVLDRAEAVDPAPHTSSVGEFDRQAAPNPHD